MSPSEFCTVMSEPPEMRNVSAEKPHLRAAMWTARSVEEALMFGFAPYAHKHCMTLHIRSNVSAEKPHLRAAMWTARSVEEALMFGFAPYEHENCVTLYIRLNVSAEKRAAMRTAKWVQLALMLELAPCTLTR